MRIVEILNVILIPLLVFFAAMGMMLVEKRRGGRKWPEVRGWWARALFLNGFQVGAVWIAGVAWNGWWLGARRGECGGRRLERLDAAAQAVECGCAWCRRGFPRRISGHYFLLLLVAPVAA